MPRNTLSRRQMLQMTAGAALAPPIGHSALDTVSHRLTPPQTPADGPSRHLTGTLVVHDESEAPSPHRTLTTAAVTLDIVPDGRGVLTLAPYRQDGERSILLPADVARELDRVLFHVEHPEERRIREKQAAGMIPCPLYHYRGECHVGLCDRDGMIHPTAVTAHLGPWITAEDAQGEIRRVPSAWRPVVDSYGYWVGETAKRLVGTSEDGRIEGVTLYLHGLGWGAGYTPPGDLPDGPCIDLWPRDGTHHHADTDLPIEWCAYLVGDPVHGGAETVGEAIDQAVASLEGRLAGLALAA